VARPSLLVRPFSNRRRPLVVGSLLLTSLAVAGGSAVAGGDLSVPGGATRLDGDQSSAVREAIDGSHARNVIRLIGDDAPMTISSGTAPAG